MGWDGFQYLGHVSAWGWAHVPRLNRPINPQKKNPFISSFFPFLSKVRTFLALSLFLAYLEFSRFPGALLRQPFSRAFTLTTSFSPVSQFLSLLFSLSLHFNHSSSCRGVKRGSLYFLFCHSGRSLRRG